MFLRWKKFLCLNPCIPSYKLNQVFWFNRFIQTKRKPVFYKKSSLINIIFLMQLVDRTGVFKDWNTLKHKHDLQKNMCFHQMQLVSPIPSNRKNIIKRNNDILFQTTTEHHFILNLRVLTVLNANSKELYQKLITTTEHKPTLQKYFPKKSLI